MWPLIIGTGVAAGLGLFSSWRAAQAAKESRRKIDRELFNLTKWYDTEYNRPYLDTEYGRSAMSEIRKGFDKRMKADQNRAAVLGATPESEIAMRDASANVYADAVNRLSGWGTQYKQGIQDRYRNSRLGLVGQQVNADMAKSQAWQNAASNVGNIAMAAGMLANSGDFKWSDLFKKDQTNNPIDKINLAYDMGLDEYGNRIKYR